MTMRLIDRWIPIYFLTTDPVRAAQAEEVAGAAGLRLEVVEPRQMPPRPGQAVLVIDLDHLGLDAHGRRGVLADLAAKGAGLPTAVCSYDFDDGEPETPAFLPARRLEAAMLLRLLQRAGPPEADAA